MAHNAHSPYLWRVSDNIQQRRTYSLVIDHRSAKSNVAHIICSVLGGYDVRRDHIVPNIDYTHINKTHAIVFTSAYL